MYIDGNHIEASYPTMGKAHDHNIMSNERLGQPQIICKPENYYYLAGWFFVSLLIDIKLVEQMTPIIYSDHKFDMICAGTDVCQLR